MREYLPNIKFVIILFAGLLMSIPVISANNRLDSLLNVLDNVIKNESQYTLAKEKKIENLKLALPNAIKPEDKFRLYKDIFTEYEAFICDSAYQYSVLCLSLAEKEKNIFWINESKLQIANTLTISGMYPESVGLLESIDKSTLNEEQLIVYYTNYYHAYNEWGEYAEYSYAAKYKQLGKAYQDSVLLLCKAR